MQKSLIAVIADRYRQQDFDALTSKDDLKPADEMAHSTGHSSRLDRGLHHPFGTCGYAREEIIAEFTAAVTGRDLGIAVTPRKENAQYLKSWLANLKEDPGYVMSVLREAGKHPP